MMMNKPLNRILLLLVLLAFAVPAAHAQNLETEEEQVVVRQTPAVRAALTRQVSSNAGKSYSGFRIRLFFASNRTAREESSAVIRRFNELYPHVEAYRSFSSPNFKVTVGNFRTRIEAEAFLRKVKGDFPDAFIVRERFKYPSIGQPDTRPADYPDEL